MLAFYSLRLLGLTFLCGVTALCGSTIFVSNTNDSGPGSLRQALADANANASITTVSLAQLQSTAAPQAARILLQSPLTVGPNPVEIIADTALPRPILEPRDQDHRLVLLHSRSSGAIRILHVHFLNGRQADPGMAGANSFGGAIFYSQSAIGEVVRLTVEGCFFEGNVAGIADHSSNVIARGGAIYFESRIDTDTASMLRVWNSLFVSNRVLATSSSGNNQAIGAAICVWNANLDVQGSQFELNDHNGTFAQGGAVALMGGVGGVSLAITPTPTDTAAIRDSMFTLNGSSISQGGATALLLSNFVESQTRGDLRLQVNRTLIDGNGHSSAGAPIYSGGAFSGPSIFLGLANSILTLNQGGAVSTLFNRDNSESTIVHCTIVNNFHYLTDGSAMRGITSTSKITLGRSVLALNRAVGVPPSPTLSPEVRLFSQAQLVSEGYNFIGAIGFLNPAIFDSTDQFGTDLNNPPDPMMGAYRDYGDGRFILPPLPGGPLTERIPESYPLFGLLSFDIRSGRRTWTAADIGAVQLARTGYDNWVNSTSLPEGEARLAETDYSGDGITNRMAYLLGLDPSVFHPNPVRIVSTHQGDFVEFVRSGTAGFQPGLANGLNLWELEISSDLENWEAHPAAPVVSQVNVTALSPIRIRFPIDLAEEEPQFFRLRVE
ncbi:MAG: hypothetical protein JJT96_17925 [Opitutales bacterium]|nr:hypothetical protein [Opitutales bacterium]